MKGADVCIHLTWMTVSLRKKKNIRIELKTEWSVSETPLNQRPMIVPEKKWVHIDIKRGEGEVIVFVAIDSSQLHFKLIRLHCWRELS